MVKFIKSQSLSWSRHSEILNDTKDKKNWVIGKQWKIDLRESTKNVMGDVLGGIKAYFGER